MVEGLIILTICSVAIFSLAFIVVSRNPRSYENLRFGFLSLALVSWVTFNFLSDNLTTHVTLYTRLTFLFGILTAFALTLFLANFPNKLRGRTAVLVQLQYFASFILVPLVFTPYIVESVHINGHGGAIETGMLYSTFVIYMIGSLLIAPIIIRNQLLHANSRTQRQQIATISWGIIIYAVLALIASVMLPLLLDNWRSSQLSPVFALILVGAVTYAIVKHGLFDIKLAAVRSLAYGLSIATLAIVYYGVAYFISNTFFGAEVNSGVSVSPINIMLALILAFIFQPIKRFFDRITDDIFFRERYNATDFYKRLSSLLGSTTDLRGLLQRAATEIGDTLKAEQALFYVWQDDRKTSAGTKHHKQLPPDDVRLLRTVDPTGIVDGVIVAELLPEEDRVRRMLISHQFAVALPLRQGNQTIGYLLLGSHQAANYTTRDVRVLATIADELTIAIRNALSVQAVKDINTTLEQRISAATKELRANNRQLRHLDVVKDEFLSMASHQLRTPLTSVKGYLSMVLDGDVGKLSEAQRTVLGEAYVSSERMVSLIHDFLNVSRIQTGKFMLEKSPTDLGEVVKSELKQLERMATSRNLRLKAEITDVPVLNIDEGKLRQVIMNFVDNALYYSLPDSTVTVYVGIKDDTVELVVRDHGIGVPRAERKQLFEKFYRASNARERRPDGTGVGLYLAKKVIDAHDGEAIFIAHKDGSSFGFRLPIKELIVTDVDEK